jgi:hypothetical protein
MSFVLNVENKPIMLSVVMVNVVMLSEVAPDGNPETWPIVLPSVLQLLAKSKNIRAEWLTTESGRIIIS